MAAGRIKALVDGRLDRRIPKLSGSEFGDRDRTDSTMLQRYQFQYGGGHGLESATKASSNP